MVDMIPIKDAEAQQWYLLAVRVKVRTTEIWNSLQKKECIRRRMMQCQALVRTLKQKEL